MSGFSPISGLCGGCIIGFACDVLLLGNGDVLGCSGILSRFIIDPVVSVRERRWEIIFLLTFFITSNLYNLWISNSSFSTSASVLPCISYTGYSLAGFFVGFGTLLGSGCTSHGLCGLARFSKRSFLAVCIFMGSGLLTESFAASYFGYFDAVPEGGLYSQTLEKVIGYIMLALSIIATGCFLNCPGMDKRDNVSIHDQYFNEESHLSGISTKKDTLTNVREIEIEKYYYASLSASLFAVGLAISGMIYQEKIIKFLDLSALANGSWDATLILVMGGGLVISMCGYYFVKGCGYGASVYALERPLKSDHFNFPCETNAVIDAHLVVGNICFGIGWAIAGFCPGPAVYLFATGNPRVIFLWMPAFAIGALIASKVQNISERNDNTVCEADQKMQAPRFSYQRRASCG